MTYLKCNFFKLCLGRIAVPKPSDLGPKIPGRQVVQLKNFAGRWLRSIPQNECLWTPHCREISGIFGPKCWFGCGEAPLGRENHHPSLEESLAWNVAGSLPAEKVADSGLIVSSTSEWRWRSTGLVLSKHPRSCSTTFFEGTKHIYIYIRQVHKYLPWMGHSVRTFAWCLY